VDANFVAKINLIPAGHNTMAVACVDRINLITEVPASSASMGQLMMELMPLRVFPPTPVYTQRTTPELRKPCQVLHPSLPRNGWYFSA